MKDQNYFLQQMARVWAQEEVMIKEADIVNFVLNGQTATGRVEHVMTDGYFSIPESKFYTPATPENPALLIRIWENGEETEYMVGRMFNEVEKV
jgi:hypothetical protein